MGRAGEGDQHDGEEEDANKKLSRQFSKSFIQCQHCEETSSRAFFAPGQGVVVCENLLAPAKTLVKESIVHELVHAFDYCRVRLWERR